MSTLTTDPTRDPAALSAQRRAGSNGPITPVPFSRVVRVEMRKQTDTLAGRWFLLAIAAVTAVVIVAMLLAADTLPTWMELLQVTTTPLSILLPVLAIMAATSEWSQRTAMTTFTLEPRRGRTVAAKVLSSLLFGLCVFALAVVLAAAAELAGSALRGTEADWGLDGWVVGGMLALLVIGLLQGSAFGFALLNTPAAIVAYLVLPTAMSVAGALVPSWRDALAWVDVNQTLTPFLMGVEPSGQQWQQLAVSLVIWLVLPMALGVWRVLHREVK